VISAVVVTYDSAACVSRCLASVQKLVPEAELVVVDNGSRDATVEVIRRAAPDARVIESGENLGFGRACNAGADAATRPHLLFLNPDALLEVVDLGRLEQALARRPLGLVAPELDGEADRRRAENSWAAEYFAHTFETLRPSGWPRRPLRYDTSRAPWVSASMLLAARDEFLEVGGFDERFFLYYEDRDLCRRYRRAGLPILTTDAIRGRHFASTSSAHEGLRAVPMAWSLLGWIEYVWISEGEQSAKRAARMTLPTLRLLRRAVSAAAMLPWSRARRKSKQLDELMCVLNAAATSGDARFCPDALRLIRNLL
jgi:N-acetylglucosaminyl-diphospho-decaprenol L-rhamnosyltransferase